MPGTVYSILHLAIAVLSLQVSATGTQHVQRSSSSSCSHRFVVAYDLDQAATARRSLRSSGYKVVLETSGFFAVVHCPSIIHQSASSASSSSSASAVATSSTSSSRLTNSSSSLLQQLWGWLSHSTPSTQPHPPRHHHHHPHQKHLSTLTSLPGILAAEPDALRYPISPKPHSRSRTLSPIIPRLLRSSGSKSSSSSSSISTPRRSRSPWDLPPESAYDYWDSDDEGCTGKDEPLTLNTGGPVGEVLPWGVKAIGAWNHDELQQLGVSQSSSTKEGNAIICLIDSGIWKQHEEYKDSLAPSAGAQGSEKNVLSGCQDGSSCPWQWYNDDVGHGTHVIGTLAAPQNGKGVVGVIPGGAEVYVVRIWNDTGDVSQGQGLYASDLVKAYSSCRRYLKQRQEQEPNKKVLMVVSMSFGSPGPLTVEKRFMDQATKAGDMLFVASAGNNGSFIGLDRDWESFPASYEAVISVANANCKNQIEWSSQKNTKVDIAAPGISVLSSVPEAYETIRARLIISPATPLRRDVIAATAPPTNGRSGGGSRWGSASDGGGENGQSQSPPEPDDPKYIEPRPLVGAPPGRTGELPLAVCNISGVMDAALKASRQDGSSGQWEEAGAVMSASAKKQKAAIGAATNGCGKVSGAMCVVELPGQIQEYSEVCYAVLSCLRGGGKGVVMFTRNNDNPRFVFGREALGRLQANCGTKCPCWQVLEPLLKQKQEGRIPRAAVIGAWQGRAIVEQLKKGIAIKADLVVFRYAYKHYDGTSMAAPHVSGAAARLWGAYPTCGPGEITDALKKGASKLPDGAREGGGAGMLNIVEAARFLRSFKEQGRCKN